MGVSIVSTVEKLKEMKAGALLSLHCIGAQPWDDAIGIQGESSFLS